VYRFPASGASGHSADWLSSQLIADERGQFVTTTTGNGCAATVKEKQNGQPRERSVRWRKA
jgi:hypothetical protein